MKFRLKDYQDEAVAEVLANLRKCRTWWHADQDRSAFALSAPTAAGKTVIAGAVIEALFHGNDDYKVEPDPGAVVIWLSDDPSLNAQSRYRLQQCADRIAWSDLVVVESTFNQETFAPGKVYFLNTQKLGKNSLLTRGHDATGDLEKDGVYPLPEIRPDGRDYTIWDTIQNTIEHPERTLYLVLDEAHRGMGTTKAQATVKSTIVRRLLDGKGAVDPLPIVWGISATIDRFTAAIGQQSGRIRPTDVVVDTAKVQESGLLKDTVALDVPAEVGQFDTVLMRRAAAKLAAVTAEWDAYTAEQDIEAVHPLLVFQVPNTPDHDEIADALTTVFEEYPALNADNVAHVFGDHTTMEFGPYRIPYIEPERVQDATWCRVLVAKDAISTGWDCPRAEVMVSFRPATDKTHITQLLGRLVRTPKARRIPGRDRLNAVDCILPFFNTQAVNDVVAMLTGEKAGEDTPKITRVLIDPVTVTPDPAVPDAVWDKLLSLPSQTLPQRSARPVKRLTELAHALAFDKLVPHAGKVAHAEMHLVLDAFQVRHQAEITAARHDVLTVEGKTVVASLNGAASTFEDFVADADLRVIDDAYRRAARLLSPAIATSYAEYLADKNPDADDMEDALIEAHIDIAALGLLPEVQDVLDAEADKLARTWLTETRVARKSLNDDRQDVYRQIIATSTDPQDVEIAKPEAWMAPTTELTGDQSHPLPRYQGHLMVDEHGEFPADLNEWEKHVLAAEADRPGFAGWYRNPSQSTTDSLAIAYQDGSGYRTVRPDFIFFGLDAQGAVAVDLVDPHGHHYADSLPKLKGLAAYAATNGHHYRRIEAVAEINGKYRVLDLTHPEVQLAVAAADDAKSLYASNHAYDY